MKKRSVGFMKRIQLSMITMVVILFGVIIFETDMTNLQAEEGTASKYKSVSYSGDIFNTYVKNKTAPKFVEETNWIFAGWYEDEVCETAYTSDTIQTVDSAYAKFVPAEVLSTKCQVTAGTNEDSPSSHLRFVTTVDSANYDAVGFEIESNGITKQFSSKTAYKRIVSQFDGLDCGFSPVAFDTESEYFVTFTITDILRKNFDRNHFVRPYWVTLDGTTVYGMARNVKVSDIYNGLTNIPISLHSDESISQGELTVKYDASKYSYQDFETGNLGEVQSVSDDANGTVTISTKEEINAPNGMLVNLRFVLKEEASVKSNEIFEVENSSLKYDENLLLIADVLHKVFYIPYNGENSDTSWYTEFKNDSEKTEFSIATAGDLYGLAALVNNGESFAGKTVYLAADIVVNEGTATLDTFTRTDGTTPYEWTPIAGGKNAKDFVITSLNGLDHTISGLCMSTTDTSMNGFIGQLNASSTVQNLKLKNSYFKNTQDFFGSIVGYCKGNLDTIYVDNDVYASSTGNECGGLVGRFGGASTGTINNCQFNGTVYSAGTYCGGIVGRIDQGTKSIANCLMSGTVKSTYDTGDTPVAYAGGIVGGTPASRNENNVYDFKINQCLVNGTVEAATKYGVGSVLGRSRIGDGYFTISSTYTTNDAKVSDGTTPDNFSNGIGNACDIGSQKPTIVTENHLEDFLAYDYADDLGFYSETENTTNHNQKGCWVGMAHGMPQLRSFAESGVLYTPDVNWETSEDDATYYISTVEELYGLAFRTQLKRSTYGDSTYSSMFYPTMGSAGFGGKTVVLKDNLSINTGNASNWENHKPMYEWMPIGGADNNGNVQGFYGSFDGNGYTISGLYQKTQQNQSGFIANLKNSICNLSIRNSYIESENNQYIGTIAGSVDGNINSVYSDAIIKTGAQYAGGLVGRYDGGTISGSWYDGDIYGSNSFLGGMIGTIGQNDSSAKTVNVNDCLFTGTVESSYQVTNAAPHVGGIFGASYKKMILNMDGCLSDGKIKITQYGAGSIGGSLYAKNGQIKHTYYKSNGVLVGGSSYLTKDINIQNTGTATLPGTCLNVNDSNGMNLTDINGVNGYQYLNLDFYNGNTGVWVAREDDVPAIKNFVDDYIEPTELTNVQQIHTDWYYNNIKEEQTAYKYALETAADMYGYARIVNTNRDNFNGAAADKGVELLADINLNQGRTGTNRVSWTPIGCGVEFRGCFNGNGHTITGMYLNTSVDNSGLFGITAGGNSRAIMNFKLKDSEIVTNHHSVGSVVGYLSINISDVYSDATITTNNKYCGGLIGRAGSGNECTIERCQYAGTITSNYKAAEVQCGGIIGYNEHGGKKIVKNCLNSGNIIVDSNVTSGGLSVGGIIGGINNTNEVDIISCVNTGKVTVDHSEGVGTVIGCVKIGKVIIENTYTTDNKELVDKEGTIAGSYGLGSTVESTRVTGMPSVISSETSQDSYTGLDFENIWELDVNNLPSLKAFAE